MRTDTRVLGRIGSSGPVAVLLPSLGRPARDFDELAARLVDAGCAAVLVEPVDSLMSPAAAPDAPGPDLLGIARDVVVRVDAALSAAGAPGPVPFAVVGHAFGNRLARAVVTVSPERVSSLVLLACGGLVPMDAQIERSLVACFDPSLGLDEHRANVRRVFFAPGNEATVWDGGWMPSVAAFQLAAVRRTPLERWWHAAPGRVLVVQGLQDVCAVPENGRRFVASLLDRGVDARLVEIDGAGHALLPEQPGRIASVVVPFLVPGAAAP